MNYLQKKFTLWAVSVHLVMQIFSWLGLRKSLYFHKKINECYPSSKSECEMSKTGINFLGTTMFKKITNCKLRCMSNQPTDKVIYTANQNILIPLRKVLPIARH